MTDERRGFRFGMKSLLLVVTVLCIFLTTIAQPIAELRQERAILDQVAALGGRISTLGSVSRKPSLGRFVLACFDASYDRFYRYCIDLSGTKLKDDDLQHLARIHHIRELDLSNTHISDAGVRYLRKLESLQKLDLSGTRVTDRGIAQLNTIPTLALLQMARIQVSDAALERLDAELPYAHVCEQMAIAELKAAGVQVVDCARWVDVPIEDGSTVHAGSEAFEVVVGMNRAVSFAAQNVLRLGYLQSLREATFHTVTFGPEGLTALRPLGSLKVLSFWFTNLTDRDLESLERHRQLESLTIYKADEITGNGLAKLTTLTSLKKLRVSACKGITKEHVDALAQQLPDCSCEFSEY